MTIQQKKLPEPSEYELWSQSEAFKKAWDSDSIERNINLAIREGWRCGFCNYSPEKQTDEIRNKRLRQLTKRELLRRHMRDHLNYQGDRVWKHTPRFKHQDRT